MRPGELPDHGLLFASQHASQRHKGQSRGRISDTRSSTSGPPLGIQLSTGRESGCAALLRRHCIPRKPINAASSHDGRVRNVGNPMRTSGPERVGNPLCHSSTVQTLQGTPHPEILSELGQDSHSSPALGCCPLAGGRSSVAVSRPRLDHLTPSVPVPPAAGSPEAWLSATA